MIYNIEEKILFEDEDIIVCYKPAGIPVQSAGLGTMDLESMLKNHLALKNPRQMPYLAVIHRLDQPVEGLLVFGKNKNAAAKLNQQIQKNQLDKRYLAVVHGKPEVQEGRLEHYLKKDGRSNTSAVVSKGIEGGKHAALQYRLLETKGKWSLVEINLETGRHHQIRVQMAANGTPLAGDHKYGISDEIKNVALCAYKLELKHPKSGKRKKYEIHPEGEVFREFAFCKE